MTHGQRRIVAGMLLGLTLGVALLHPCAYCLPVWVSLWWGAFLAQTGLLAVWAVWRRAPWASRLPPWFAWTALLGLLLDWGSLGYDNSSLLGQIPYLAPGRSASIASDFGYQAAAPSGQIPFSVPIVSLALVLPLLALRRLWRWEIVAHEESAIPSDDPRAGQFTIRQLLLWITASAVYLGMVHWLLPMPKYWDQLRAFGPFFSLAAVVGIAALLALGMLPMLVGMVGVVLAPRRRWFALTAILGTLAWVVFDVIRFGFWQNTGDSFRDHGCLAIGFFGVLWGVLGIARACGYRLERPSAEMPEAVAVPRRSRFIPVVVGLSVVSLLLGWPAVQEWHTRSRDRFYRSWEEAGFFLFRSPQLSGEEMVTLAELSNRPFDEALLARFAEPRSVATFNGISLCSPFWTDGRLARLKVLSNLENVTLGSPGITDAGLVHLQGFAKLNSLFLAAPEITDAGLGHLERLPKLKYLRIFGTKVTPEGVAKLRQALPDCEIVRVDATGMELTP